MTCRIVRIVAIVAVLAAFPIAWVVAGDAYDNAWVDAPEIEAKGLDDDDDDGGDNDDDEQNEVEFTGIITSLPSTPGFIGAWTVSGRTVHVTANTEIDQGDGPVVVGARVKVEGTARIDGSVDAQEIEVLGQDDDDDDDGDDDDGENDGDDDDGDDDDDDADFEFTGIVQTLPATAGFVGDWTVGGRIVHVTSATRIKTKEGPVVLGALVEVRGSLRADGSIDATRIEVEENEVEIKGIIESLPATSSFVGDWRVGGRIVRVGLATRIDQQHGAVAVGALVEVKGSLRADGSIAASEIEVESSGQGNRNKFNGTIEALPASSLIGDWRVSGRLVHVVSSTKLKSKDGVFAVGTSVKVKGISMPDGSLVANKIQIR